MLEIIGQAIGILATVMTILLFQLKTKKQMLLVNVISNLAVATSDIFIKGELKSGAIICLIAIVQLIASYIHDKKGAEVPIAEKIIFLVLYILYGCYVPKRSTKNTLYFAW